MITPGDYVSVHDPLGYSGLGTVRKVQSRPHDAVLVLMHTITDRTYQGAVDREVWVLTGHVSKM